MEIDVRGFLHSKTEIQCLFEKQNSLNLIRELLERPFSIQINELTRKKSTISFNDPELNRIFTLNQILVESAMQIAHSMYDLLIRIIYFEIIKRKKIIINEREITASNIDKKLDPEKRSEKRIKEKIRFLRESTFYRYINGFVNIVKHRGIVKQNTQIDSKGFFGPIIEEFKYDENNFEKKRWTEAFENIQDLITEIVSCVGIINEEIKEYEENKECKT